PVREQMTDQDLLLARGREFRPVRGHRGVQVEQPPVGEQVRAQRHRALRRGPHVDHGVPLPGPCPGGVRPPAPQVHHRAAVHRHGHRGAQLLTLADVLLERRAHRREPRVAVTVNQYVVLGHGPSVGRREARTAAARPGRPRTYRLVGPDGRPRPDGRDGLPPRGPESPPRPGLPTVPQTCERIQRSWTASWKGPPPSWSLKSYTSIDLSSCAQELNAANTVDGGQVWSSSATENSAGARPRAAKCTPSKYDRVRRASAVRPGRDFRNRPISRYGGRSVSVTARGKSHRNGTSGATPARSGTRPP